MSFDKAKTDQLKEKVASEVVKIAGIWHGEGWAACKQAFDGFCAANPAITRWEAIAAADLVRNEFEALCTADAARLGMDGDPGIEEECSRLVLNVPIMRKQSFKDILAAIPGVRVLDPMLYRENETRGLLMISAPWSPEDARELVACWQEPSLTVLAGAQVDSLPWDLIERDRREESRRSLERRDGERRQAAC